MLLKFIFFTLIALNPLVGNAAFGDSLRQQKSPPSQAESKSNFVNLDCFMKTASGKIINLSELCDRIPKTLSNTKLVTSNQYNYPKVENFNRRVYGD